MQLENLLAKGHFPVQLPPGFTTKSFASQLPMYQATWDKKLGKLKWSLGERFSVARSSYSRRNTSILNPVGFYALASKIAEFWPQIEAHFAKSPISRSIPGVGGSLRAIDLARFSDLYEDKVTQSAGARYALITDISSYFPTIYTHTVPWALHGKSIAKAKKNNKTKQYFGNILDACCMAAQDGQTIGLPIGPDTSHIIAEIIGVAIDLLIHEEMGVWPKGFRYVDDFALFFNRREDAERALAVIVKCVGAFELQINPSKTRIIEVRELVQESWKYSVKKLAVSHRRRQQRDDIHHYFEVLFSLETKFKDESLIKYGLKQISSIIIKKSNWAVFEAYLLKCGYGFPNALQVIAQILSTYNYHGYDLNKSALTSFSANLLESASAANHHSEVAWLLWLCKEVGIVINSSIVKQIFRMGSSVCSLIALDLIHAKQVSGEVGCELLASSASQASLYGAEWLIAYEGGRRQWLNGNDMVHIESDDFFGPLLAAKVFFYDQDARLNPIFDFKDKGEEEFNFDSDEEIGAEFEFDEMDEEYFDSSDDSEDSAEPEVIDWASVVPVTPIDVATLEERMRNLDDLL